MAAQVVAATVPFTLASLKAEIANAASPLFSEYQAHPNPGTSGPDAIAIAALLNDNTNSGAGPIPNDNIPAYEFRSCFTRSDVLAITGVQNQAMIFQFGLGDSVDIGNPDKQDIIEGLLASYPTTLDRLRAKYTMTGSRAKVLWGKTVAPITDALVQQAALLP